MSDDDSLANPENDGDLVDETSPFWDEIGPAFLYPVRGQGWAVLLSGWLCAMLGTLVWISPYALFVAIFGGGLFFGLLCDVVRCSALGRDQMPSWPEVTEAADYTGPWRKGICAFAGPTIPLLVLILIGEGCGVRDQAMVILLLTGVATWALLLPITILSVVMRGSLTAFFYGFLLRSTFRTRTQYLILFMLSTALAVFLTLSMALAALVPFAGLTLGCAIGIYLLAVLARLIGVFYRSACRELAWPS